MGPEPQLDKPALSLWPLISQSIAQATCPERARTSEAGPRDGVRGAGGDRHSFRASDSITVPHAPRRDAPSD